MWVFQCQACMPKKTASRRTAAWDRMVLLHKKTSVFLSTEASEINALLSRHTRLKLAGAELQQWNFSPSEHRLTIVCSKGRRTKSKPIHLQTERSLKGIASTLSRDDTDTISYLDYYGKFMSMADWFALFDELGKRECWLVALEVLRWLQQQKWYKPNDGFYAKMIASLGKNGQQFLAIWLFKQMKSQGFRPDTSTFNALIAAQLSRTDKELALVKVFRYFEQMKSRVRCKPDLVTYNTLLRACAQLNDKQKMHALFKEMDHAGFRPDIYTFNGILDAFGKDGSVFDMELTLKHMRQVKVKPDLITFNILIDAYGKAGIIIKMEEVLLKMAHAKIKPQLLTYNSLINNYGNAGRIKEMELIFENIPAVGFSPTVVTYEVLIRGYGKAGYLDEMRRCFDMMCQDGIKPETSTLNALLEGYCCHSKLQDAEDLLVNANQLGMEANSSSYLILYKEFSKQRCTDKAERLIDKMNAAGIRPNEQFFLHTLEIYTLGP